MARLGCAEYCVIVTSASVRDSVGLAGNAEIPGGGRCAQRCRGTAIGRCHDLGNHIPLIEGCIPSFLLCCGIHPHDLFC